MEISDIIEDSFKYPISDFKKLLILGIPFLVIGIFALLFIFESIGISALSDVSEEAILSSPLFSTFLITTLLFIIVTIICSIIMNGIGISVIKETIKPSDSLPNIELKTNLLNGIKSLIVSFIYIIVPTIIFFILVGIGSVALGENSGILDIILILLYIIAIVIVGILLTVAICRLAETNSISEALNISNIIEIGKKIGLIKIFATILICNVILGIISLVGSFINMIPIIGSIIVIYILYTYMILVTYRAYGLLYRDITGNDVSQTAFQQPPTPIENNQTENNNEIKDFNPADNNENQDIKENTIQNNDQQFIDDKNIVKKCKNCGSENPNYATFCVNCGNEL